MRFGRRSGAKDTATPEGGSESDDLAGSAASGPFDESEVDLEAHEGLDLGGLVVTPDADSGVQLQVDEESGQVIAVVLFAEEGGLELRAFASSRGAGAWDELRPRIATEMTRMGGTATEQDGAFGIELLCMVPVQTPEGEAAMQPSRIIGCEGPNWLLRATLIGRPAVDDELGAVWEEKIRRVVVRRGRDAMPPGAPLPLTLPPETQRA